MQSTWVQSRSHHGSHQHSAVVVGHLLPLLVPVPPPPHPSPPSCPSLSLLRTPPSIHPLSQGEWGSTQKESEEEQAKRSHFAKVNVTAFNSQMAVLQKSYEVCLSVHAQ